MRQKYCFSIFIIALIIHNFIGCKKESNFPKSISLKFETYIPYNTFQDTINNPPFYCQPGTAFSRWQFTKYVCATGCAGNFPITITKYPKGFIQFYPDSSYICKINKEIPATFAYGQNLPSDSSYFLAKDTIWWGRFSIDTSGAFLLLENGYYFGERFLYLVDQSKYEFINQTSSQNSGCNACGLWPPSGKTNNKIEASGCNCAYSKQYFLKQLCQEGNDSKL